MTCVQVQCLLAFLGHYPHSSVDGIWGDKSRAALREFQRRSGLPDGGEPDDMTQAALRDAVCRWDGDFWSSVRHFRREEFRCRCGGRNCGGFPAEPSEILVRLADDVRSYFGAPAHTTSGLRCAAHNAGVGGVSNSRHLSGKALDFYVEGIPGDRLLARVLGDPRTRYAYRISGTDCVHMDVE